MNRTFRFRVPSTSIIKETGALQAVSRKLTAGYNNMFLIVFTAIALVASFTPAADKFGLYRVPLTILLGATVLLASFIAFMSSDFMNKMTKRQYYELIAGFLVFGVIIQIIIARALEASGYNWDAQQILDQAVRFALHGNIDVNYVQYTLLNPNNIGLLTGLGSFFAVLHHFGVEHFLSFAIALNIFLMSITQYLLFRTAYVLYGRKAAFAAVLFGFIFISLSLYVDIPYTDTLTIVFPMSILYLCVKISKQTRALTIILLCGLMSFLAVVGSLLKPTVIIAYLAAVMAGILWLMRLQRVTRRRVALASITCFAISVIIGLLTYTGAYALINRTNILPYNAHDTGATSVPPIFFAAMGMKTTYLSGTINYGGYDAGLSYAVRNIPSHKQKVQFSKNILRSELTNYGSYGYANFLAHKTNWIMSDSTFYAFGEGSNSNVRFNNSDALSRHVRSFAYVNGRFYQLFGNILQIFWITLLLLIGAQLLIAFMDKPFRQDIVVLLPRLMISGILLFLLLFEGRSRYIFLYLPIFIITALPTLSWFETEKS